MIRVILFQYMHLPVCAGCPLDAGLLDLFWFIRRNFHMPKKQEDKSSPLYAPNFTRFFGMQGRIFIFLPIVHCFKIIQYAKKKKKLCMPLQTLQLELLIMSFHITYVNSCHVQIAIKMISLPRVSIQLPPLLNVF